MDIITYIPDLIAFRIEAEAKAKKGTLGFVFNDEGSIYYTISKIPVIYKGLESLCLVRLISDEEIEVFESLTSCQKIGVCENNAYVFDDGGKAIYESVYDTTPRMIDDGEGGTIEYTPPYMIGLFA